jgi:CubicO group peptidase (beta-lactamase class C family)
MKRLYKYFFIFLLSLLFFGIYKYYPQLEVLNGYAARAACSCTFVSHRPLELILKEDLGESPLNLASIKIDTINKFAESSVFGLKSKKAVYRNGLGCILLEGNDDYNVNLPMHNVTNTDDYYFVSSSNSLSETEKEQIVALAFDENKSIAVKKTRALLVLHRDSLILEEYAKGVNANTMLLGWSMTKSIVNALVGILSLQNKISINDKSLFKSWTDNRKNISVNDLLHMKSGLKWNENYATVSEATIMLFGSEDMPKYASSRELEEQKWYYSSGTSNLLSGVIRSKFKGLEEYHHFPYNNLFKPLGMENSLIETDEAGNFIGSSYMYATAKDWLRFGRLYLKDGVWQGKRILPQGWVKYTATEELSSNGKYGAHFWLNKNRTSYPDCPDDLFVADGYQGQYVVIIPSKDLVIVRLGLSDIDMNGLIKKIIDDTEN